MLWNNTVCLYNLVHVFIFNIAKLKNKLRNLDTPYDFSCNLAIGYMVIFMYI